jgi:hypothetical protein
MAKNHLAIDINSSAVRFVKMNGDFVLQEKAFVFSDKQDYRYKQQLEEFWNQTGFQEQEFDDITLSWSENQTALVPVNVFNESTKDAVYSLCFGQQISSDVVDYNRLPLQGIVNVFAMPLWVKSFFVIRFPRIVMQHEGTHLIRGVFAGSTFKLKTKIVLHEQHFLLLMVQENKLKFYSAFEWNTIEDVAYYYSFTMQQQEVTGQVNEVELVSGAGAVIDLEQLKNTLEHLHRDRINVQIGSHIIEKHQQLCV